MNLYEHELAIEAAIHAALADGYEVDIDLYFDRNGDVRSASLDILQYSTNGEGERYLANYGTAWEKEYE